MCGRSDHPPYPEQQVMRRAMDRERKRLVAERQQRMRGASQRWTQHIRNAALKRMKGTIK